MPYSLFRGLLKEFSGGKNCGSHTFNSSGTKSQIVPVGKS